MNTSRLRQRLFGSTYALPIVIAIISGAGLLLALIGNGVWDSLSWLALGFPIAVGMWFSIRRKGRPARLRAAPGPL